MDPEKAAQQTRTFLHTHQADSFPGRLTAGVDTREYGVLTILTARHADVSRLLALPPGAFRPAPRVSSAVVRLTFRPPQRPVQDEVLLVRMVRAMFTQRRKTLANNLRRLGLSAEAVQRALAAVSLDVKIRAEQVDTGGIVELFGLLG